MTKSLNNTPSHTGEGETLARAIARARGAVDKRQASVWATVPLIRLEDMQIILFALTSKSSEEERLREALRSILDDAVRAIGFTDEIDAEARFCTIAHYAENALALSPKGEEVRHER